MRDHGYVEGQNIVIEHRLSQATKENPALVADLLGRKIDILVTWTTPTPTRSLACMGMRTTSVPPDSAPERTGAVCGGVHWMITNGQDIVGVSSVVRDGAGRILLIKTVKASWELPGGRVEQGEVFITGVTSNTGVPRVTILTFQCRHIAADPYPGDDLIDAGWFAPDTAVGLVTHPVEQMRLKDALGNLQGVIYGAYRRLPSGDRQRDRYEMLRLHRC